MRLNLFGGSNSGKSRTALYLCSEYKRQNLSIEIAREVIKVMAYEGRKPTGFDQLHIFDRQMQEEEQWLRAGVKNIVTDSPLLLQGFYARRYNFVAWQQIVESALLFESSYQSLNIFLDREGVPFNSFGRYEDEAGARAIDRELIDFLQVYNIDYQVLKTVEVDQWMSGVAEKLDR